MDEELIGGLVARLAQALALEDPATAHFEQDLSGNLGQVGGEFGIGHHGKVFLAGKGGRCAWQRPPALRTP